MLRVSILGGSGYVGGELLRLLIFHSKVEIIQVTSRSHIGRFLTAIHPHLRGLTKLKFSSQESLDNVDILFLCLPHGLAQKEITRFETVADLIIDLSADFRLQDLDLYNKYYDSEHVNPSKIADFVYGIVEINKERIANSKRISSAGCNATASILGLYPLVEAKMAIKQIVIDAKVGTSESGRNNSSDYSERVNSLRSYKPTLHRHAAEIVETLKINPDLLSFSATSMDIVRGVLVTIHLFLDKKVSEKGLWQLYRKTYQNEQFIRIVKERTGNFRYPDPKLLAGTNYCDIGFEVDEMNNRIVIMVALDNLMKGAAGQAIHAMNVNRGFDENEGLAFSGMFP